MKISSIHFIVTLRCGIRLEVVVLSTLAFSSLCMKMVSYHNQRYWVNFQIKSKMLPLISNDNEEIKVQYDLK